MEIKRDLVRVEVEIDASLPRRTAVLYEKLANTATKAVVNSEITRKTQTISRNLSTLRRFQVK